MFKRVIIFSLILIFTASIAYGSYTLYQINNPMALFNDIKKPAPSDNKSTEKPMPSEPSDGQPINQPDKKPEDNYKFNQDRVNILLLGLDASVERYQTMTSFRTDVIIVASIDFKNQQVYLLSIPRDTYTEIPGTGKREKINAAFVRGGGFKDKGFEKTLETVTAFLGGIPIDYYVATDMNVVKEIVDAMGGVDYDVDINVSIAGRTIEPGFQHLNGQQVLDYARSRHSGRGDIDRIDRQQKIILSIFNQLKSTKQLTKIPEIFNIVKNNIFTNINLKQVAALALFSTKIDMDNLHRYTAPGGFLNIDKISYWGIDQYKKQELIKEIFNVKIDINLEEDINYLKQNQK